ncbi:MAG: biotin--[acetyl-CoA-carboxylase] ligase [Dehalococcoidales bacterium]|nr:biotin--[acetyl-CoA-carboxylase] ligase [Dehalococcoidales bacterium]
MPESELSAEIITNGLNTKIVGQRVIYLPSVTSTMDAAKQEARRGASEGTAVTTDEQTAGKGRIKRQWLTPHGNIAISIILRPDVADLPYLIMMSALAVARCIETTTGVTAQIKWPNDVLISGKKVCGILAESEVREDKVIHAVIGIGINVVLEPRNYADIAATATSLNAAAGKPVSRVVVIRSLLTELDKLYLNPDRAAIFREWRNSLVTLGKRVKVTSGGNVTYGIAESVDGDGSLMLRDDNGVLSRIVAGDVTVRPVETK